MKLKGNDATYIPSIQATPKNISKEERNSKIQTLILNTRKSIVKRIAGNLHLIY